MVLANPIYTYIYMANPTYVTDTFLRTCSAYEPHSALILPAPSVSIPEKVAPKSWSSLHTSSCTARNLCAWTIHK